MNTAKARRIVWASLWIAIVVVAASLAVRRYELARAPKTPIPSTSNAVLSRPSLERTINTAIDPAAPLQTVIAAGDIADCNNLSSAAATADLIDNIPGTVLAVGDLAYPNGTEADFQCYDRTWGRHKARTRPTPGNHEHHVPGTPGYFKYFGESVGTSGRTYYSFDLGAWHIISLDSDCREGGGCKKDSPQELWLREDLKRNTSRCILAFWHAPLFSSGSGHGYDRSTKEFWNDLYDARADIVLGANDHDYERFAPQRPDGTADTQHGIREFVVGTGGRKLRPFKDPSPLSEVRDSSTFGVLQLNLHPGGYDWKFLPVAGASFSDSGSDRCHAPSRP